MDVSGIVFWLDAASPTPSPSPLPLFFGLFDQNLFLLHTIPSLMKIAIRSRHKSFSRKKRKTPHLLFALPPFPYFLPPAYLFGLLVFPLPRLACEKFKKAGLISIFFARKQVVNSNLPVFIYLKKEKGKQGKSHFVSILACRLEGINASCVVMKALISLATDVGIPKRKKHFFLSRKKTNQEKWQWGRKSMSSHSIYILNTNRVGFFI